MSLENSDRVYRARIKGSPSIHTTWGLHFSRGLYCSMNISRRLYKLESVLRAALVYFALVGIYSIMTWSKTFRENATPPISTKGSEKSSRSGPHLILSGHNCSLEDGIMSVKTTKIWDSRVVKVRKL